MLHDPPLQFTVKKGKDPGTRIFRLTGPLTLRNLFEFQAALRQGPGPGKTVIDLSGVPYMDSAAMGTIVNCYVHCQKAGGTLMVAGVSSRVMELFRLTKVDTVIPLRETLEPEEFEA
jgi:anti-sigma B factor antagonist